MRRFVKACRPWFDEVGAPLPERILSMSLTRGKRVVATCYARAVSKDGTNEILVRLDQAEAIEVADHIVDELVHAADDCQHGHGKEFEVIARKLGLTGVGARIRQRRSPLPGRGMSRDGELRPLYTRTRMIAPSSKVIRLDEVRRGDGDPAVFARALAAGETWAERGLLEQHTGHLERILTHILGRRQDIDDLVQEVFVRAFERVDELREPRALRRWLTAIAVFVARETIRARKRRRWLVFLPPAETPEIPCVDASPELRAAVKAFYEVVGQLDADDRIAFTLRFVEGMELTDVAAACGVSLATIKRRLKQAEAEFSARGRAHEALADWFEESTRWQAR
jgi:RNA polymerase sigma-70 factor (ECF subfamily)